MSMDYHEVLAKVGAGSAHPGGMQSTLQWMQDLALTPESRVLDVGCGTGRSLLEIKERFNCQVVGVDLRGSMIEKARMRAAKLGRNADFLTASAESLPFPDASFDFVYTESVNVFLRQPDKAMNEYFRVLKAAGIYVDVEMMVMCPVDETWKQSVHDVYGARHVPDFGGWKRMYKSAGFLSVTALVSRHIRPEDSFIAEQYPDDVDLASPGAYQDPRVSAVLAKNAKWMNQHYGTLGYVVFRCAKAGAHIDALPVES